MKADDKKLQLKIGAFVMIGVGLIMTAILILGGKSSVFSSVSHYTSHFPKIDGLISGAKVGMGGLQVGTVSSVAFDGKNRDIEVKFTVARGPQAGRVARGRFPLSGRGLAVLIEAALGEQVNMSDSDSVARLVGKHVLADVVASGNPIGTLAIVKNIRPSAP